MGIFRNENEEESSKRNEQKDTSALEEMNEQALEAISFLVLEKENPAYRKITLDEYNAFITQYVSKNGLSNIRPAKCDTVEEALTDISRIFVTTYPCITADYGIDSKIFVVSGVAPHLVRPVNPKEGFDGYGHNSVFYEDGSVIAGESSFDVPYGYEGCPFNKYI